MAAQPIALTPFFMPPTTTTLQDARQSTIFRLAASSVPIQTQQILAIIYTLSWRLERILRRSSDELLLEKQLAWWYEEVDQARRAQSSLPVFMELSSLASTCDASQIWSLLQQFIEHLHGCRQYMPIRDEKAWDDFAYQRRGIWLELCAQLSQFELPTTTKIHLAKSMTIYDMALGHALDVRQNLSYWPHSLIERHGLSSMYRPQNHAKWQPLFDAYLQKADREFLTTLHSTSFYHPMAESLLTLTALLKTKVYGTSLWYRTPGERISPTLPLKYLWTAWNTRRKYRSLTRGS